MGGRGSFSGAGGGGAGVGGGASLSPEQQAEVEAALKQDAYIQKKMPGLNARSLTNKYWTMDRVSADGNDVVVRVNGDTHIQDTKYGKALLLDQHHAVFLRDKDVAEGYYGTEVHLNRQYFKVKEWGDWGKRGLYGTNTDNHSFDNWASIAKEQAAAGNEVRWKKTRGEQMVGSFSKQAAVKKARKNK